MGSLVGLEVACEPRDRAPRPFGAAAGLKAALVFPAVEENQVGILGRLAVLLAPLGQQFMRQALPLNGWSCCWGMGWLAAEKGKERGRKQCEE